MMRPVTCGTCGNEVLCEKFSPAHTQIQWTAEATEVCPRIRERVAAGEPSARVRSCAGLRDSIREAVSRGLVEVGGE
ncbi:hypothetical protein ACFYVL_24175 [Streptomyces sp. NPDC004111]|uniref:hypothetical protein n=1 Tax=Streptomyces sp. NPDC004111 TaxID=3364690 RepID=UPI00369C6D99